MSTVEHVEVIVEEPSMEAFLQTLLPKVLQGTTYGIYVHQGKTDLLQRLPQRLAGYSTWLPETWRVIVVVDRDDDDCKKLKKELERMASSGKLGTTRSPRRGRGQVISRIAIEELEAWYFGDWNAVVTAYPKISTSVPRRAAFRDPDRIKGGTWEAFERLAQRAGYFENGLRKIEAARSIAAHMVPDMNTSQSFQVLRMTLEKCARKILSEGD
jgi:Domain of unknown function (DUF4276)